MASAKAAVEADNLFIPLIDFSNFLSGPPPQREETARQILHGFQQAGFIYLQNHGISAAQVANAFSKSGEFFKRPQEQKDALEWDCPESNRGYTCMGREKVTNILEKDDVEALRAQNPDLKESLEIGREGIAEYPNPWPDRFDADGAVFKKDMLSFFDTCKALHVEVMRAVAIGLGIDELWFDQYVCDGDNTLRLLHYPPVHKDVFVQNKGQVRAGAHSDYGSITLLFQDQRGGLQVQSPNGNFVDATPIPDTIVVNAGDLLARWSNDNIKSTIHRVVEPPKNEKDADANGMYPARYSIAYFCNPNFDKLIEVIPGTIGADESQKYKAVNSGDYLIMRLAATY